MKRTVIYLALATMIFSCKDTPKKEVKTTKKKEATVKVDKIGLNNYAIVWKWATKDKKLVEDNLVAISNEINKLEKNGQIEIAYYNPDAKVNKFENFPNISYFLKANSKEDAQKVLNNLSIVKKGIATYTIYPVGTKWFGRKAEVINQKGITNSYVTVWKSTKNIDTEENQELTQEQAKKITKLYNEGTIENVFWELSGEPNEEKRRANEINDFVFFVNANTEEEAKKICDNLPFTKKGVATYKMYEVGAFWFGNNK